MRRRDIGGEKGRPVDAEIPTVSSNGLAFSIPVEERNKNHARIACGNCRWLVTTCGKEK
jgi:hypothetical protein